MNATFNKYLLTWFLLAIVCVVNGVLREATYGQYVSALSAHQISTGTAILATGLLVWGVTRVWPIGSSKQAWLIGIFWLVGTMAFEFVFGYFVVGHSLNRLFAEYNLFVGRIWPLFLLWITVMPYIFYKQRLAT